MEKKRRLSPGVKQFEIESSKNEHYQLMLSVPDKEVPIEGFPVFYVLDGNAFFHTIREMVRVQSHKPDKTGVVPMVIVGLGHPTEKDFDPAYRIRDYTFPIKNGKVPPQFSDYENGQAEAFANFIESEVKPLISEYVSINTQKQALFGHSLGGLFVLYSLFNYPGSFQRYVACSPSLWWDDRGIYRFFERWQNRIKRTTTDTRIFMAAGSLERDFMREDVRRLADRFAEWSPSLFSVYHEAEGENHISAVHSVISKILRFVSS
ncbi:alpha/beta hydrolase [Sediminibacillus dalangtanensis]|uniref:Alpha/beta hydrolase n=1 Tax=Sediminibacillus dalangtanensis TaxID=2729421 RepID=A0ABX7VPH9_9BACI|nr:alpha/beta hydrolase-fold protein [Sediminibacillus dalangtanensis]QTM98807.1 alpha/beta hydrolase [Sediminibacillus dalangtanensis]